MDAVGLIQPVHQLLTCGQLLQIFLGGQSLRIRPDGLLQGQGPPQDFLQPLHRRHRHGVEEVGLLIRQRRRCPLFQPVQSGVALRVVGFERCV